MNETTKGYVLAGIGGAVFGSLTTFLATKWLPEYQERVARRQGAIIAEEISKKGNQYKHEQNPSEFNYIAKAIDSLKNSIDTLSVRMDDLEKQLRDYRGANM